MVFHTQYRVLSVNITKSLTNKSRYACTLLRSTTSVRAMQNVLDLTVNAKKPDDLAHKLPYK